MQNQILLFFSKFINRLSTRNNSNIDLILNFGPQHPAAHGVLRLVIKLNGEYIMGIDPHIGFLHRGTEKLAEQHSYLTNVVFIDRLDYTSVLTQTHAYALAIESGVSYINSNITLNVRTIFDELSRILNHLLALATHALDIGTMSILFWAFEDRERIMEIIEYLSGARMHACLYMPLQNFDNIITQAFLSKIYLYIRNSYKTYTELYIALYNNKVWRLRLINVGILNSQIAINFGATGVVARASGLMLDLRTANILNYGNYSTQKNITYLGIYGDSYDRFLIRVRELFTATTIIYNNLSNLSDLNQITLIASRHYTSINTIKLEKLINLFSIVTNFISLKQIISFGGVESGKGYFQITIISSGIKPYRLYIRSPAYAHLQLLATLATGHALADITTLLGSLDIVFGEVDR